MKLKSQSLGTFSFPADFTVEKTATLNKADLTEGNNKYYQIEAHVSKDKKKFRLYSRYGRVGHGGTEEERIPPQDLNSLLAAFESLKAEKTSSRKGYVEVHMAATKMGSTVNNARILSDDIKKDKLTSDSKGDKQKKDAGLVVPAEVGKLVTRLFEEAGQAVRSSLSGSLQTTAENPLGTLTLTQINTGKNVLQEIQDLLTAKPKLIGGINQDLIDLSSKFYSSIPQVMELRPKKSDGATAMNEWLKKLALNEAEKLDKQTELLDLLSDVQGMVGGFATTDVAKKYSEIGCEYTLVDDKEDSFKRVKEYFTASHSRHHSWSAKMVRLWRVNVKGQKAKHLPVMQEVGNIKPLFHGSGPQNILGICKHGLLMRPPGVYVTGSMFGNGLYFADQSSKSQQYAFGRYGGGSGSGDTYFMFVADVALGKIKKYQNSQSHLSAAPKGYHSVQGEAGSGLVHNEFIIYTLQQHLLQYLIEFSTRY
jgi:poly [ADP-ribose] polymerase